MKRRGSVDFLFLFPCLLAFSMVILVPFGMGIYYALSDWNGVRSEINFIGFQNFKSMFTEPTTTTLTRSPTSFLKGRPFRLHERLYFTMSIISLFIRMTWFTAARGGKGASFWVN